MFNKPRLFNQNSYGGYDLSLDEYVIFDVKTPHPWVNICANQEFGTVITEKGEMFSWYKNSYLNRITPRIDDTVLRQGAEKIYLKDLKSNDIWQPMIHSITRHGLGYSVFESKSNGLDIKITILVPVSEAMKLVKIEINNNSNEQKSLSATYYNQVVLGESLEKTGEYLKVWYDEKNKVIKAQNTNNQDFSEATFFLGVTGTNLSYELDRAAFFGKVGNSEKPEALHSERLRSKVIASNDPCATIAASIKLRPGGSKSVIFTHGVAGSGQAVCEVMTEEGFEKELAKNKKYWQKTNNQIEISTPNKELDVLFNRRLLYQILVSRLWARTGFYQPGGAYGYRDQLQDVIALSWTKPDLTREHILRSAGRQFLSGGVQHWWHPPGNQGIRSLSSDAHLWLVYTTLRYIEITGDTSILDEKIPFLLTGKEESAHARAYFSPESTEKGYRLYEHCVAAIERTAYLLGKNDLPLILSGDWNDALDLVGKDKLGESLWLAMFFAKLTTDFSQITDNYESQEKSDGYLRFAEKLKKQVEKKGWDGDWYIRAFWDSGEKLGTKSSSECKIDSLTQSWSAIADFDPVRSKKALSSANNILIDKKNQTVKLFDPPFDKTEYDPGYILKYPPGVRENGGAYAHAAGWLASANAIMGNSDEAMMIVDFLNPFKKTQTDRDVEKYQGEPYVMAADVCTAGQDSGLSGWTWYTGSAGILYGVILESILGIKVRGNKLELKPSVPKGWSEYKVNLFFKKTPYHITFKNGGKKKIEVQLDGMKQKDEHILMRDDGQTHNISAIY